MNHDMNQMTPIQPEDSSLRDLVFGLTLLALILYSLPVLYPKLAAYLTTLFSMATPM